MDRLVSKKEAAALLAISVRTLDRLRASRQIAGIKVRGAVRFRLASITDYIRRNDSLRNLRLYNP